jgi:hypothetical protein
MRERCCVTENGKRCKEICDITVNVQRTANPIMKNGIHYFDLEEFDLCMNHYDSLNEFLHSLNLAKIKDKTKIKVELI